MNARLLAIICWAATGLATNTQGKPWIDKLTAGEVNWTTLRLEFAGLADAGSDVKNTKDIEKLAWKNGVGAGTQVLGEFFDQQLPDRKADTENAKKNLRTSLYSVNTTYYSNGRIRVDLEVPLAKILNVADAGTQSLTHNKEKAEHTGIVIKVPEGMVPTPYYTLVVGGKPVFDFRYISKEGVQKNLAGRWIRKPKPSEWKSFVGEDPLILNGQTNLTNAQIDIPAGDWDRLVRGGDSRLMSQGQIVFAVGL